MLWTKYVHQNKRIKEDKKKDTHLRMDHIKE